MAIKNLIIAHRDIDGIASAAGIVRNYQLSLEETDVIFAQPGTLSKISIRESVERIFVADIGIDNQNPSATKAFIERIKDRMVVWYDHHYGWGKELVRNPSFRISPGISSCAMLIGGPLGAVIDSVAADTRKFPLSEKGTDIERALKSCNGDPWIPLMGVRAFLGEEAAYKEIKEAAKKYAPVEEETKRLATGYRIINRNTAFLDVSDSKRPFDMTQLLLAGQRIAMFAVIKRRREQGEKSLVISTFSSVDLLDLFDIPSGAKFRVSVPASRKREIFEKLTAISARAEP